MSKRTIIPIGPYHALQEEPEFFKLHVEGETVVHLDIELGYNHRGIEKLSESKDYEETIFLVERICGICSTSHPIACAQAVEEAGDIFVPERALFIRSAVVGELERIHSHLLWLGLAGHFLGFNTIWMWAWRFREDVLNILELISGNRNHYAMIKPGGVRRDIAKADMPAIRDLLDGLKDPIAMFRDTIIEDPLLNARTKGVGIIKQCLVNLETAQGPIDSNPKFVAPGEGIGLYEAPRGEVFHYIRSDGSNRPVRHKVRAPSFMNVPTNCVIVLGTTFILLGGVVWLASPAAIVKGLICILFILITSATAAHALARAAHRSGAALCDQSVVDRYADDRQTDDAKIQT